MGGGEEGSVVYGNLRYLRISVNEEYKTAKKSFWISIEISFWRFFARRKLPIAIAFLTGKKDSERQK